MTAKLPPKLPTVMAEVTMIFGINEYEQRLVEVEVLTVHFKTGTMRVRYKSEDYFGLGPQVQIININNTPYLEKYGPKES